MLMIKHLFVGTIFFFCISNSYCQGYKIDLTISGLDSAELYLGYYINGKTYLKDSATYVSDGKYSFEGNEPLDKGMYFVAKNTTLVFDLVVGEDQTFELQTNETEYASSMKVIGDQDNRLFFENMFYNLEMRKEAMSFVDVLKDSTASESEKGSAQQEMESINKRVFEYQDEIIAKYPESILATLFKSTKQVEIPDDLISGVDDESNQKKRYYYIDHYWDLFDLGDPVLLRLPNMIYNEKVDDYLDNLILPAPDSIKMEIDALIEQAKRDKQTYQHLVWHLTIKYQTSKIMGMDEVYVHIVDNYFMTGEMDFWANDQLKKNLKEKADQYRNSLIGMIAPNLILQNLDGQPTALHDLSNKYSIIYFYDPDCSHCKKETPILKAFYESSSYDVGIYTVSADTSITKMKNYIDEMNLQDWVNTNGTRTYGLNYLELYDAFTTPTIYLLNEKKEIIAKKIAASQLNEAITNYEKFTN